MKIEDGRDSADEEERIDRRHHTAAKQANEPIKKVRREKKKNHKAKLNWSISSPSNGSTSKI